MMDNYNNEFSSDNSNNNNESSFNDAVFNETPRFYEYPEYPTEKKSDTPLLKTKKKNNTSKFAFAFICVIMSLVVGAASGYISANYVAEQKLKVKGQSNGNAQSGSHTVNITVDETVNSSVEAVAAKVSPSVVGIRTTAAVHSFFGGSSESTGEGSGIVYTTDGYIITNYHVIESAVLTANSSIEVFFESDMNTGYSATVVGYNISYDLAVIKIDKTGLTKIELADTSNLKVGQYCVAIGAPGGLEYMGSVTNGIISGLNRTVSSTPQDKGISLIQTDTAINPGNSGGALVNLKGELIGVNSSKIVSESYEGMGFAIPTNTVVDICDKIIAKEYNPDPYVGITFSESWTPKRLQQYGYPVGAVVTNVVDGAPAYEGGIRSGDIIIKFNGEEIEDYEDFNEKLSQCEPGKSVSVEFYRSGRYYSTAVTVGSNNSQ